MFSSPDPPPGRDFFIFPPSQREAISGENAVRAEEEEEGGKCQMVPPVSWRERNGLNKSGGHATRQGRDTHKEREEERDSPNIFISRTQ